MFDADDGWETTAPVGSFPEGASPFGVLDLAGNVGEWTADRYGAYSRAAEHAADPVSVHVSRGGGWHYAGQYAVTGLREPAASDADAVQRAG